MKKIIYTRQDGGLSVVHPVEGARLAFSIMLADGTVLPKGADTPKFKDAAPVPVDSILRRWPVEGAVPRWAETEDEFVTRIAVKDVPADAIGMQIVDATAVPADRTFREAWKSGISGIVHDMPKCREIHKNKLRELRAPKLAALDVEYMRTLESGDTARMQQIAAQKQALRDVTKSPALTAANTPDELKAAIPDILK